MNMDSFAPEEFIIQLERQLYNKYNERQNEISATNRGITNMVWEHRGSRNGYFRMSQMSNLLPILT